MILSNTSRAMIEPAAPTGLCICEEDEPLEFTSDHIGSQTGEFGDNLDCLIIHTVYVQNNSSTDDLSLRLEPVAMKARGLCWLLMPRNCVNAVTSFVSIVCEHLHNYRQLTSVRRTLPTLMPKLLEHVPHQPVNCAAENNRQCGNYQGLGGSTPHLMSSSPVALVCLSWGQM